VNREVHAGICGSPRVRFPGATRPGPFPGRERAFCVTGNVTKGGCRCGILRPDRWDGLALGETGRNPVDGIACDLWAPGPKLPQAPTGLSVMNFQDRA
jgi:hypothetical protein